MLKEALGKGYKFILYDQLNDQNPLLCVLRHDIDIDLHLALEMAKIEADLGIKSTYFIMLRSPVYNLFSRSNSIALNQILILGHDLGLHYDAGFHSRKSIPLVKSIMNEIKVLETMFGKKIKCVSFHQPSKEIISSNLDLKPFKNTYNDYDMAGFHYVSDSNKNWKKESAYEIYSNKIYDKFQLLIHPIWWMTNEELSTEILWRRGIINAFDRMQNQIVLTERAYGKPSKFEII